MKTSRNALLIILFTFALVFAATSLRADESPFANLTGKLVSLQNNSLAPFDAAKLANVKYYAIYDSASWCPPCRAFTPKLVAFYNRIKPLHSNFELIFVCHDESAADMLKYMQKDRMPWPALNFALKRSVHALTKYCGSGIPCLVFVDDSGKVISNSFEGKTYVGPEKVMGDIEKFLQSHPASATATAPASSSSSMAPIPAMTPIPPMTSSH